MKGLPLFCCVYLVVATCFRPLCSDLLRILAYSLRYSSNSSISSSFWDVSMEAIECGKRVRKYSIEAVFKELSFTKKSRVTSNNILTSTNFSSDREDIPRSTALQCLIDISNLSASCSCVIPRSLRSFAIREPIAALNSILIPPIFWCFFFIISTLSQHNNNPKGVDRNTYKVYNVFCVQSGINSGFG